MLTNSWLKNLKARLQRVPVRTIRRQHACRPVFEVLEDRRLLSTFTVLNTNDSGAGSLRQAILNANITDTTDRIEFNIAGAGVHTIAPTSALPIIEYPVIIDGYTQPGSSPNTNGPGLGDNAVLRIELDGSGAGTSASGLHFNMFHNTESCLVQGLVINRFGSLIGGGAGVAIEGRSTLVQLQGNFIGTDASGTLARGNNRGIDVGGSGNTFGGAAPAMRNVISGNLGDGLTFGNNSFFGSGGNLVQNNFIGTDVTGTVAMRNQIGIVVASGHNNRIGGLTAAERNVISGNTFDGIQITDGGQGTGNGNIVRGNFIGTQVDGAGALGNGREGVSVDFPGTSGPGSNTIGGTSNGAGNIIAFNARFGVSVSRNDGVRILGNSIFANGRLGIDLATGGPDPHFVTFNDPDDADSAFAGVPNGGQNYPVLNTASSTATATTISGSLNSTANTAFRIEFFANAAIDPSGFGEGQAFLGFTNVTTPVGGNDVSFTVILPVAVPVGHFVTTTATDPAGNTSEFSFNRVVVSGNRAPSAGADAYSVNEDGTLTVAAPGVLANDSDPDGDLLSFGRLMTQPQHGAVQFQADGSFTYTPDHDFVGADSFSYRANDASLTPSNVATVNLIVLPVNDVPNFTSGPDVVVFEDSGPASISGWATGLSAGPADESGQELSFQVSAANPALFAVQPALAPDGTLTFTPAANANGSTLVTITLHDDGGTDNDGNDTSTPRSFSVLIVAVNDAPTASDLSVGGPEDTIIPGQVGGSDVDGDPLSFALATGPQHGTLSLTANGFFLYEPSANFNGTDSFTFTAIDTELSSVPATVTITVIPVNDPSLVVADDYSTHINTLLDVPAAGSVVLNDFDIDGDSFQFAGLSANPTHGLILFQADGSFHYTPQAGFVGTDTFSYLISDGQSVSAPGAVTIHVLNDSPTANNDSFTVPEDSGITNFDVLANDTSAPNIGETLMITSVGAGSAGGTITIVGGTSIDYYPAPHFTGIETFTYTINDGTPGSDATASVAVTVEAAVRPSRIQGLVWEDFNDDGAIDFGEKAIANVSIRLTGRDDLGNAVDRLLATDAQGIFEFLDLRPSDQDGYTLTETQPAGYLDGKEALGTINGLPSGIASDNVFAEISLSTAGWDGTNYNFGERPAAGGAVQQGQTATIGFWQNKNGQNLIQSLNGGPNSSQLGDWLAQTLPNMYGSSAGSNSLAGKTNSQLATLFVSLFKRTHSNAGPPKLDAQVLAAAFAVYVTNESLAGQTAAAYGFQVTANGLGAATFDIGNANRGAFGLSLTDSTVMTVLDLLLTTNSLSRKGLLYDLDGSGAISSLEKPLLAMANSVFAAINEQGDI